VPPSHHGYQRAYDLISGQVFERTVRVTSVRMRREDRSSIVVSSSRRPPAGKGIGYVIDRSLASRCSFVRALRPFLRPGLRVAGPRRAQGPSRLAVALSFAAARALPGHALTGPSTARRSSRSGRHRMGLHALEGTPFVENRPGDAGKLVGERDRQHVVMQALPGRLNPGLEAIAVPMLGPDLTNTTQAA
jgi:hypothetical protein